MPDTLAEDYVKLACDHYARMMVYSNQAATAFNNASVLVSSFEKTAEGLEKEAFLGRIRKAIGGLRKARSAAPALGAKGTAPIRSFGANVRGASQPGSAQRAHKPFEMFQDRAFSGQRGATARANVREGGTGPNALSRRVDAMVQQQGFAGQTRPGYQPAPTPTSAMPPRNLVTANARGGTPSMARSQMGTANVRGGAPQPDIGNAPTLFDASGARPLSQTQAVAGAPQAVPQTLAVGPPGPTQISPPSARPLPQTQVIPGAVAPSFGQSAGGGLITPSLPSNLGAGSGMATPLPMPMLKASSALESALIKAAFENRGYDPELIERFIKEAGLFSTIGKGLSRGFSKARQGIRNVGQTRRARKAGIDFDTSGAVPKAPPAQVNPLAKSQGLTGPGPQPGGGPYRSSQGSPPAPTPPSAPAPAPAAQAPAAQAPAAQAAPPPPSNPTGQPDMFDTAMQSVTQPAANVADAAGDVAEQSKRFGMGRLALGGLGLGATLAGGGILAGGMSIGQQAIQKQPGFGMQSPAYWQTPQQM